MSWPLLKAPGLRVIGIQQARESLYEGYWKEYLWVNGKSLPAETGGKAAGK